MESSEPESQATLQAEEECSPMHTLYTEKSSVLSVAADENYIYSGSQNCNILVWDRFTFSLKTSLLGHTGSVLCLEVAKDRKWLFSSSGDSTVRVWCTGSLMPLYIINPYLDTDAGDIFCVSYVPSLQTLYFGCQNTSLQWFDFSSLPPSANSTTSTSSCSPKALDDFGFLNASLTSRRGSKRHKFFADGVASGHSTPTPLCGAGVPKPVHGVLQVEASNVIDSAHVGYIYSMALTPSPLESARDTESNENPDVILATGSGDETVNLWKCTSTGPILEHTLEASAGAVLSLIARHETIYAGCQDGAVKVFDLGTRTLVRTIIAQEGIDILSLSMIDSDLYTCSANGCVQRWSADVDYNCTKTWAAHNGIVLSSFITKCIASFGTGQEGGDREAWILITGANDNCIKLWPIDRPATRRSQLAINCSGPDSPTERLNVNMHDVVVTALSKFVSFPSVSSDPKHREDCRQAAIWLKNCLSQLGAESSLVPTIEGRNPLVLATFRGSQVSGHPRSRILFYGHYDVMSAPSEGWDTNPFILTGRNGYLYGRGATDDKGPIIVAACAASELLKRREMDCDLVMLIEGEEEVGSIGLSEAIKRSDVREKIGHIDGIIISNSTWISEERPCITYGMRGVIHCSIEIANELPDLHSGVDGGAVSEPMIDMVNLLARLSRAQGKKQHVLVPGFYDEVQKQGLEEKQMFELLATVTGQSASSFLARWSEPSLSVHSVEVSGPGNPTVIPSKVGAKVSLRIVPNQDLETITNSLREHLLSSFSELQSPNKISVKIDNSTDWWLGDIKGAWFKALEGAIQEEWGIEPLRIREGGSIPSVPFLEKELSCQALHLPIGQSSDRAHLNNERISLDNLQRGKSVIQRFLKRISTLHIT